MNDIFTNPKAKTESEIQETLDKILEIFKNIELKKNITHKQNRMSIYHLKWGWDLTKGRILTYCDNSWVSSDKALKFYKFVIIFCWVAFLWFFIYAILLATHVIDSSSSEKARREEIYYADEWIGQFGVSIVITAFSIYFRHDIKKQESETNIATLVKRIEFNKQNRMMLEEMMKPYFPLWEIFNYEYYKKFVYKEKTKKQNN